MYVVNRDSQKNRKQKRKVKEKREKAADSFHNSTKWENRLRILSPLSCFSEQQQHFYNNKYWIFLRKKRLNMSSLISNQVITNMYLITMHITIIKTITILSLLSSSYNLFESHTCTLCCTQLRCSSTQLVTKLIDYNWLSSALSGPFINSRYWNG